jgi:hypothetical protein
VTTFAKAIDKVYHRKYKLTVSVNLLIVGAT